MSLEPQLVESESYGRLNLGSEDIADRINASVQKVRQAMRELIKARILIEDAEGYRCPYIEDDRKNVALREEIKTVFARFSDCFECTSIDDGTVRHLNCKTAIKEAVSRLSDL